MFVCIYQTEKRYFASASGSLEKEKLLLYNVVYTFGNVFLNDSQRTFVNKERELLIHQIENEIDYDNYRAYVSEHLTPCISNLTTGCLHDDVLYQVQLKTFVRSGELEFSSAYNKNIKLDTQIV